MAEYTSKSIYVTQLEDLEFFQGDTVTIPFVFVDQDGDTIPLKESDSVRWYLCPFGQYRQPVIILDSKSDDDAITVDDETNIVYVHLSEGVTKNLTYGKYTQQPVLVYNTAGKLHKYIRAEGNIIFKQNIHDFSSF